MRPLAAAVHALVVHYQSKYEIMEATSDTDPVAFSVFAPEVVEDFWKVMMRVHHCADGLPMFEALTPLRPHRLD